MSSLVHYKTGSQSPLRERSRPNLIGRILKSQSQEKMSKLDEDKELIARTMAGDKQGYRRLVEKYQSRVYSIVFEIVKNKEDAEDIAQESFVKAYLSLPDFKGQSSFYTWLYRIAFNMAIDLKRKLARRGGGTLEFDEGRVDSHGETKGSRSSSGGPQETLLQKERLSRLNEGLREISEEHRVVILLREVEGLSYDQIADVVGISKGTVMSRLHYARKRLSQLVDSQDEELAEKESKVLEQKENRSGQKASGENGINRL